MTEDVSSVAAPWLRRVVEGEEVEMGRLEGGGFPGLMECFVGESVAIGGLVDTDGVSLCCVCIRVFTTSNGVVITPAIPPAEAAVKISNGNPMLCEPM